MDTLKDKQHKRVAEHCYHFVEKISKLDVNKCLDLTTEDKKKFIITRVK